MKHFEAKWWRADSIFPRSNWGLGEFSFPRLKSYCWTDPVYLLHLLSTCSENCSLLCLCGVRLNDFWAGITHTRFRLTEVINVHTIQPVLLGVFLLYIKQMAIEHKIRFQEGFFVPLLFINPSFADPRCSRVSDGVEERELLTPPSQSSVQPAAGRESGQHQQPWCRCWAQPYTPMWVNMSFFPNALLFAVPLN